VKMVIAFIQHHMEADIVRALRQVHGVTGATFSDARGFGRGRQRMTNDREELYGTAPRLRVDLMVSDDLEDTVVRLIADTGWTGQRGDGTVYVVDLIKALRISTGEEGSQGV
jgi:nitrogen regulatory protein P-II 1